MSMRYPSGVVRMKESCPTLDTWQSAGNGVSVMTIGCSAAET